MIIENTFSQKEFELAFLNESKPVLNPSQKKLRKRLHIEKLNEYENQVTKTYFFVKFTSADVLYQFNIGGNINKTKMKISWFQDILIHFLGIPLFFLGLGYY